MAGRIALLDVNVLVALFFPGHVHHDIAHDWLADERALGWATCPVTINGFIRVASRLEIDDEALRPDTVVTHLRTLLADTHHHAWAGDVRLTDESLFAPGFIRGHSQVTDVYLLGVAVRMGERLVTFDRSIPLPSVRGATSKHLAVIAPADDE